MTRRPSTTRQHVKALEAADDAGVQILRVDVPGPTPIVVPGEYTVVDIGDVPLIPAYAVVLFAQVTFEHRSTDPESLASAEMTLGTFLDGEEPNTGSPNISLTLAGVAETTDWTFDYDKEDTPQFGYGEQAVYLYGYASDAGEGSEFRNISGWFAYVSPSA